MKELTQEYLKQCLDYNPETGIFTWKERPREHFKDAHTYNAMNAKLAGKVAGCFDKNGYIYIRVNRKNYYAHRLAWLYLYGMWPKDHVDHINGIPSDNRICNLRDATIATNKQNLRKANKDNSSGFLGVTRRTENRFEANIKINGENIYIGSFNTAKDAHAAYIAKKRELHPYCTI